MLIIPAIDLKDGKCVRLRQGRAEDVTVFGDDPVAMGLKWQAAGAQLLHVVDLDGAFSSRAPKPRIHQTPAAGPVHPHGTGRRHPHPGHHRGLY